MEKSGTQAKHASGDRSVDRKMEELIYQNMTDYFLKKQKLQPRLRCLNSTLSMTYQKKSVRLPEGNFCEQRKSTRWRHICTLPAFLERVCGGVVYERGNG